MRVFILALTLTGCVATGGDKDDDGPRSGYPSGPYGKKAGDVIDNLSFVTDTGEPLAFADIHADGKNELLLVSTAAGWCTACIEEQPALEDLYDTYGSQGLVVLVSVFEDADFEPADPSVAADWRAQQHVSFLVVADAPFVLADYYDTSLTPMNMLVDLASMEILRVNTSFDKNAIEAIVEAKL